MTATDTLDIATNRLEGINAIAQFRGEPPHRTRYLIRIGVIPVMREGQRFVASKSVLRDLFEKGTAPKPPGQGIPWELSEIDRGEPDPPIRPAPRKRRRRRH
jgi:hypothetical protein